MFIGGYARTGSTMLDRLLGQIDGFASFGELRHIWERSFLGNQLCGCGRPFRECPFWTEVVGDAFGGFDGVDAEAMYRHKREVAAFWDIPRIKRRGDGHDERLRAYAGAVATLYRSMHRVSGARFLVDSTKDPQHYFLLASMPGFDVRMVHLVRDSRAVAFSWRRVRPRPEVHWQARDMPRFSAARSATAWDLANMAAGAAGRGGRPYVLVRYEDLVLAPREEISRIIAEVDLGPADLGFLDHPEIRLEPSHTVAGNPMRFEGTIRIRADEEWRDRMLALDRAVVTTLTWPLLGRYGYRGGGRRPRAPFLASAQAGPTLSEVGKALRLAMAHRSDPLPYGSAMAGLTLRYLASVGVGFSGRWLDVGTGVGTLPEALARAGASAVGLDLSDRRPEGVDRTAFTLGRGERLPFRDGAFDGVVSSNVLEHVRDPWGLIAELLRVCRPGGVVYLSWTNWFSPFGGHDWSPFHYLGSRLGPKVHQTLFKRQPLQVPGRTLFPVHVGPILRGLRRRGVPIVDVAPRYWPSLRFLARIPLLREVAMWNCVIVLRKPA